MKKLLIFATSAALALTAFACQEHPAQQSAASCEACDSGACAVPSKAVEPKHVAVPTTGVRTITLPTIDTELPPGPGKITLVSTCTLCHSPRYVTMQPNFSRKKWTDEVEKMKKVYGAPLQDEQVEPIVNYLVAIRGNGQ